MCCLDDLVHPRPIRTAQEALSEQNNLSRDEAFHREGAMARFRDIRTLQKFASAHASIFNHFNHDRYLNRRDTFKKNRSGARLNGANWRPDETAFFLIGDGLALV